MPEEWRHGGNLVIGTTAERAAFDTSTLRPDNRWFDTDLQAFLLWDGTQFVHRFADNVILYDDDGDSPSFSFVGGSNDDTITMFLDDDAVAGDSDLVIRLCAADDDSQLQIQSSAPATVAYLDAAGNAVFTGHMALGASGFLSPLCLAWFQETMDGAAALATYGLRLIITKSAGATDIDSSQYAAYIGLTYDQPAGTIGELRGQYVYLQHNDGSVGSALFPADAVGLDFSANLWGGTVHGDAYAQKAILWQAAAHTVGGDLYGLYTRIKVAGTVTGTSYGVYLEEDAGDEPDYGLYHDGIAPWYIGGDVGLQTTTVPHGGVGYAMLALDGANTSAQGPHVQFTTAYDDYPLLQFLNWGHDNVWFNFDCYYDGSFRSSDAGSNFQLYKESDLLKIRGSSGTAAGNVIAAWADAFTLTPAGRVGIMDLTPDEALDVNGVILGNTVKADGTTAPASGAGTELMHDGAAGYVTGYDRTGAAYTELAIRGSPLKLNFGGTAQLAVRNGYFEVLGAYPLIGTGSNYPNLGSTTTANKWGHVYLGPTKDVFPYDDGYGLFERHVNWARGPAEHWKQGSDDLAWTGWAGYVGYVNPPSYLLRQYSIFTIGDNNINRAFYYRAATGAAQNLIVRAGTTFSSHSGVMVDDGVDAGDGLGANNFVRLYLDSSVVPTQIQTEYRTGGGAVTTTTFTWSLNPVSLHGLWLYFGVGTLWTNWGWGAYMCGEIISSRLIQWAGAAAFAWTPARVGLYWRSLGVNNDKRALFDWYGN